MSPDANFDPEILMETKVMVVKIKKRKFVFPLNHFKIFITIL